MTGVWANSSRVLLVVSELSGRLPGGVGMRQRALEEALKAIHTTRVFPVAVDPFRGCAAGCTLDDHRTAVHSGDPYAAYLCPKILQRMREVVVAEGIDVAVVSNLPLHGYARALAEAGDCRVVFDLHNAEYPLARSLFEAACGAAEAAPEAREAGEAAAMEVRQVEERTMRVCDEVWVCSAADRETLAREYGRWLEPRSRVVPNVVPVPAARRSRLPGHAVFTGRFDYLPNLDAAMTLLEQIAPLVGRRLPGVPIVLAGAAADSLASAVLTVPSNVRLVSGPRDVAHLIASGVMAVPLAYGGGTRFKVLEAMALGAPVVSTAKGVEGLNLVPGRHYLEAEDAETFVEQLHQLIHRPALRDEVTRRAHAQVGLRYSIEALIACLTDHVTEASLPGGVAERGIRRQACVDR